MKQQSELKELAARLKAATTRQECHAVMWLAEGYANAVNSSTARDMAMRLSNRAHEKGEACTT